MRGVLALPQTSRPCRAKGKSCDVILRQQNQGRAGRVYLLQHAASPCTAHGNMSVNSGPFAGFYPALPPREHMRPSDVACLLLDDGLASCHHHVGQLSHSCKGLKNN